MMAPFSKSPILGQAPTILASSRGALNALGIELAVTPIDNRLYVTPTVPLKKGFDEVQAELTEIKKNLPNKAPLQTPSSITPPAGVPVP